jgi:exopolysaccharide production protein ExoZ
VALTERLQSIQILRAVAVLPVIFFHFAGLAHGKAGVDLFFVISGFVMAGLMHQPPGKFARDRFIRIYPPFLAALVFAYALFPKPLGVEEIVKTLILWPIHQDIFLYPAWSLSYEAMFYAACVASMFVPSRYVIAAYAVMFALGVPFFGSGLVLEFLAGFAIARRQWWALPVLLGAATFEPRVLLYGPPAALLLWLGVSSERWLKHHLLTPVAMIGDASYAIYLTHVPVGSLLFGKAPAAALIYACLMVGVGFHFIVEKPLLRLVRRGLNGAPKDATMRGGCPADLGSDGEPAEALGIADQRGVEPQ